MIILGVLVRITEIVKPESVFQIIEKELKGKNPQLNKEAFEYGQGLESL